MKFLSWNIARREAAWRDLAKNSAGIDFALLQEANAPPPDLDEAFSLNPGPFQTGLHIPGKQTRKWRTAIVDLSSRYDCEWIETVPIGEDTFGANAFPVSLEGTIALAKVEIPGESLTLASVYGAWDTSNESLAEGKWIYADAAVHRIISDLSALIGKKRNEKVIVAGDFNLLYGYGEDGSPYWARRYDTVFSRMEALGFRFIGPQFPNGKQADPWPKELPRESKNVPTYHTAQSGPEGAWRQLDFVFASESIADRVTAKALNLPEEWGPSDHCRIEIDVEQV